MKTTTRHAALAFGITAASLGFGGVAEAAPNQPSESTTTTVEYFDPARPENVNQQTAPPDGEVIQPGPGQPHGNEDLTPPNEEVIKPGTGQPHSNEDVTPPNGDVIQPGPGQPHSNEDVTPPKGEVIQPGPGQPHSNEDSLQAPSTTTSVAPSPEGVVLETTTTVQTIQPNGLETLPATGGLEYGQIALGALAVAVGSGLVITAHRRLTS